MSPARAPVVGRGPAARGRQAPSAAAAAAAAAKTAESCLAGDECSTHARVAFSFFDVVFVVVASSLLSLSLSVVVVARRSLSSLFIIPSSHSRIVVVRRRRHHVLHYAVPSKSVLRTQRVSCQHCDTVTVRHASRSLVLNSSYIGWPKK